MIAEAVARQEKYVEPLARSMLHPDLTAQSPQIKDHLAYLLALAKAIEVERSWGNPQRLNFDSIVSKARELRTPDTISEMLDRFPERARQNAQWDLKYLLVNLDNTKILEFFA